MSSCVSGMVLTLWPFIARYHKTIQCKDIGCDTLPQQTSLRCDTPRARGFSAAILAQYHSQGRKNGCDSPSAILSRKLIVQFGGNLELDRASTCRIQSSPNALRSWDA